MSLPYYSKDEGDFKARAYFSVLELPRIKSFLGNVIKKNIALLPFPYSGSLCDAYGYIIKQYGTDSLIQWKGIIEVYLEVLNLVAGLGKYHELFKMYSASMHYVIEGQQELFHCEQNLESIRGSGEQVKFRGLLDKYHCLYENNIKYSIAMVVYALDVIINHSDLSTKNYERYCLDDVSYNISKIASCQHLKLKNDLNRLIYGLEPHVRNAIAHKKIEYGENKDIILRDRGGWQKKYLYSEFENLIQQIEINQLAQNTAMVLWTYEHEDVIDFNTAKPFSNIKQLRSLIDTGIKSSYFEPIDILIDDDKKVISCDVQKQAGFDYPSTTHVQYKGVNIKQERPPLLADQQAFRVIRYIAALDTDFKEVTFNILDYNKECLGIVAVNLEKWTELVKTKDETKDKFDKHILKNTFIK